MMKLVFNIGDKLVKFKIEDFKDNVDLDKLLKIDYGNLLAEMITFPVILNKIGILNAEMEQQLRVAKMNFKIREAKISNQVRNNILSEQPKATVAEVNEGIMMSKAFQKAQMDFFNSEKQKDYIMAIYVSAKSKSELLTKLSLTLKTGDIDAAMIQKQLNNVYYKLKDNDIN